MPAVGHNAGVTKILFSLQCNFLQYCLLQYSAQCTVSRTLNYTDAVHCTEVQSITAYRRVKCATAQCSVLQYSAVYAVHSAPVSFSSVHCATAQCTVLQYRAVCYSAVQYVQYSAVCIVQCSVLQHSAVSCSTVQCSTAQCSVLQYRALCYITVQCPAVQCSVCTVQYTVHKCFRIHPCWWRVCYQRGIPHLVSTSLSTGFVNSLLYFC